MISIIGESPSARKEVTCRNCAARLEYTPSDVKEYHGKDYTGGADGKEWIDWSLLFMCMTRAGPSTE